MCFGRRGVKGKDHTRADEERVESRDESIEESEPLTRGLRELWLLFLLSNLLPCPREAGEEEEWVEVFWEVEERRPEAVEEVGLLLSWLKWMPSSRPQRVRILSLQQ
jgi:hypothetical protein